MACCNSDLWALAPVKSLFDAIDTAETVYVRACVGVDGSLATNISSGSATDIDIT